MLPTVPSRSHFYPRSPRGERPCRCACCRSLLRFLSTLPARGATPRIVRAGARAVISIHAPREGSDVRPSGRAFVITRISIHAPREGSDRPRIVRAGARAVISIHAPREGSDRSVLPTVPSRSHFYPRSPRGERLAEVCQHRMIEVISIHAPREGSDFSGRQ